MIPSNLAARAVVFCLALLPNKTNAQKPSGAEVQTAKTYFDSRSGIEEQFAELIRVSRASDDAAIQRELDSLRIPDVNGWIAAHFLPEHVAREQDAYRQAFKKFRDYIWSVIGGSVMLPEFGLKVEESQVARALSDEGFEGLVPRPKDAVKVENFRFISTVNNPKLGNQNWVSSFIYLEGRFRMIGGTYPFWAESLNATRGPMSLPPRVIQGRTVQAEAFRKDAKGPGIDAIVHIKIEVGPDGKIKSMNVLSGDSAFISDAKQYLKDGEYPKMPNDPRLANMRAIWDMEVVFFTSKNTRSEQP